MDAGALDRLELRDLAERYAFAADRRDGTALAATFTDAAAGSEHRDANQGSRDRHRHQQLEQTEAA